MSWKGAELLHFSAILPLDAEWINIPRKFSTLWGWHRLLSPIQPFSCKSWLTSSTFGCVLWFWNTLVRFIDSFLRYIVSLELNGLDRAGQNFERPGCSESFWILGGVWTRIWTFFFRINYRVWIRDGLPNLQFGESKHSILMNVECCNEWW